MSKWQCDDICTFFEVYRNFKILYNVAHKDHMNCTLTSTAFLRLYNDVRAAGEFS